LSACLERERSWVQSPALKKNKTEKAGGTEVLTTEAKDATLQVLKVEKGATSRKASCLKQ
jgi:hypothetical protein